MVTIRADHTRYTPPVSKQTLLLVDGDTRSLRVLEVSLRKAGFTVTPAPTVKDALDKLELHAPDLIIAETSFATEPDGFELRRRVRGTPDWADIPFIFLTAETAIEHKIRGLELGVDDYLTKPIYIKEIVTRINILLQKKQRAHFEDRRDGVRFAGRVADMPVVDIIQTIEVSRKSGVIQFAGPHGRQAAIYFRDGKVIDAEAGTLSAEDAVYRLLTWNDGEFEVVFRTVRRRDVITTSSQGLLMEGMRRLDEWSRLLEQLPPLSHRFEIDVGELSARLGEIPDEHNQILRLFDGKRTLMEVIDGSDVGDLECLQAVSKLYFEDLLIDLDPGQRQKRDTGRPVPLVLVEDAPTPMEEVVSGPISIAALAARAGRSDEEQRVEDEDVVEQEVASEPGPLLGGYRPSSLRLIDEAVAAAQAIDPELFDSLADANPAPKAAGAPAPEPEPAQELVDDATLVPAEIIADEPPLEPSMHAVTPVDFDDPTDPTDLRPIAGRDESGLRMIGSLGRDHAEASGELEPSHGAQRAGGPQRELVTIMPRRNTRERAAVTPPAELLAGMSDAPATNGVAAPSPAKEPPADRTEAPVEPARAPASEPPRRQRPGTGVRREAGPGGVVKALMWLSAALAAGTAYVYCHGPRHAAVVAPAGSGQVASAVVGSAGSASGQVASGAVGSAGSADSENGAIVLPGTQKVAVPKDVKGDHGEQGSGGSGEAPKKIDKAEEAKALLAKAQEQLDEANEQDALELADKALALHHSAKGYLVRARALRRLQRIDEALTAFDAALAISPDSPEVYLERGWMLWSVKRYAEARPTFEKYLQLAPNTKDADDVRKALQDQP